MGAKYRKGQIVAFNYNTKVEVGEILTVYEVAGEWHYNIKLDGGREEIARNIPEIDLEVRKGPAVPYKMPQGKPIPGKKRNIVQIAVAYAKDDGGCHVYCVADDQTAWVLEYEGGRPVSWSMLPEIPR